MPGATKGVKIAANYVVHDLLIVNHTGNNRIQQFILFSIMSLEP